MNRTRRTRAIHYLLAVIGPLLALGFRLSLSPWLGEGVIFLPFVAAILLVARLGGLFPGLLATAVSAVAAACFLMGPSLDHPTSVVSEPIKLVIFCVVGASISYGFENLHSARARSERERQRLAHEIEQREIAEKDRNLLQQQLDTNTALYRSIGESIDYGLWTADATGRLTYISDSFLNLVGHSFEQLLSTSWSGVLDPAARDADMQAWEHCVKTESDWDRELRVKGADGQWHAILARGVPSRDAEGKVTGWAGINLDISRLKAIEKELLDSDALLRQFLDNLSSFVGLLEPDGTVLEVNSGPFKTAEISAEAVVGKKAWDTFWWRHSADERCKLQSAIELAAKGETSRYDVDLVVEDGERIAVDLMIAPLRDLDGNVSHVVSSAVDITERKRALDALKESERQYRVLTESFPTLLWSANAEGFPTYFNQRWFAFTGQSPEKSYSVAWREIVHPDDFDRVMTEWRHSVNTGTDFLTEYRIRRASDGEYIWHSVLGVPNRDEDGNVTEWFGSCADIDDKKKAEEALQLADDRKDRFIATLAHELRNPLAPIRSGLEVLQVSHQNPEVSAKIVEIMERQLAQMVRLVDDLLDVSRIKSNKMQVRMEQTKLSEIIGNAVDLSQSLIDGKQHKLRVTLPDEEVVLTGDPIRLTQVVSNILDNAAKYTDQGGVITLDARLEGSYVVITVEDNGIGISKEQMPSLFDMFSQGAEDNALSMGGLGIGLSLVKRLVEKHSGTVEVVSNGRGTGSKFVVRIPQFQDVILPEIVPVPELDPQDRNKRVMIVDDNEDVATTLSLMLQHLGYEAMAWHDGLEAIGSGQEFQPDIVLLDLGMPHLDGYEVATRIRKESWGERVLLVALTGWGGEEVRRKTSEAGFDQHLVKPIDLKTLERTLALST